MWRGVGYRVVQFSRRCLHSGSKVPLERFFWGRLGILGAAPTGGQRREKPGARPHTPPPPNPADADDARPLGASATHSKISKTSPRAAGPAAGVRVLMMLAGWPPGVVHGGPETRHRVGNGCETRARSERPQARSRAAQWKRGSDEAGSAARAVVAFAKA